MVHFPSRSKGELAAYRERNRVSTMKWAMGCPYHNKVDDECAPDFSCCYPDLFEEDPAKRWDYYHKRYPVHRD